MKLTNEQINAKAGQILGYCDHDWSGEEDVEHYEVGSGEKLILAKCIHCFAYEDGGDWDELPDFCTDLNQSQHLVEIAVKKLLYSDEPVWDFGTYLRELADKDLKLGEVPLLPAKTITLAALVAAGKIMLEDAKEALEVI